MLISGGGNFKPLRNNELDVSFVIPVYNSETFLERCVMSLLNQQTSASFEVICINDGSTDGSLDILLRLQRQYPDKLVVLSQQNEGISATRNRGIEEARGEYVGFIDNDDFVSPGYIETLWQCRKKTDSDMIQIGHNNINVAGDIVARQTKPDVFFSNNCPEILQYATGFVWSGIHRKTVFQNLRFPVGYWYEDMITKMLLVRLCHRYAFVEECLYNKTAHSNNASNVLWSSANPKCIDQLYLLMHFIEFGNNQLHLPNDSSQLLLILNELRLLWSRTKGMSRQVREALFVIGCDFVQKYGACTDVHVPISDATIARFQNDFFHRHYLKYELDGWIYLFYLHLGH